MLDNGKSVIWDPGEIVYEAGSLCTGGVRRCSRSRRGRQEGGPSEYGKDHEVV